MANIYYDDHMVGIFGMVANHCYAKGYDKDWVNKFWAGLQEQPELYEEFIHYFNTSEVLGNYELYGFSVLDTFVYEMKNDSRIHDKGRSGDSCEKDNMVLQAFERMIDLKKEPERWIDILDQDKGMDWI